MEYFLHILVIAGIYIILTLGLNLIVGFTGLPSLGHIAFACVGAYASSLLALNYGISPWLGLVSGACIASLSGLVVGFASIRLKGDYLALATFGLGVIIYAVSKNWVDLTRGPMGLPGIPGFSLPGFEIQAVWTYLMLVIVFVFITPCIINRIAHSPFGRILKSIREDELASLSMGKDINKYKLLVFVIGAFFAGIAGSLYAHYITFIDPSSFTPMESIAVLLMVVFGGMGSMKGSFLGALILVIFPEMLRFLGMPGSVDAPLRQMIYGLLLIILIIKRPQGIVGKYRF
ncbi:MAG: branched-chain amino acid ABC transporter permease [Candidatus Brocadia sp.]|uniref:High-affinity branched-chain amino acid transport system permease protein LivH n=1 Tax=Candidatus Brocadia fulgida TaxID=380242 RepID=A0A0M2UWE5_9BACT|nr:MAG: High-affinity branched-chain amino acid transport system permease protein LivH [Candidatus Brocadia fulgida]MCE7911501.1 branched-chain amino acid ABC transporter permease [Candidatus Brocadia sp. AMX3]MDG5996461.1 branched-chain amino acid ABC transporter permease [Candidatus Brocadia sp.]RIK01382.1 MAG: branched-chain amino acid ABC transporter permease [Candidatus Brocadia sp.]UJS19563.1 MAG: branched-chain amino acid ABC transporter permease [Candidatus Brocadia sp.]